MGIESEPHFTPPEENHLEGEQEQQPQQLSEEFVATETKPSEPVQSEVTNSGLEYLETINNARIDSPVAAEILTHVERVEAVESLIVDQIENNIGGRSNLDLLSDGFWQRLSISLESFSTSEREELFASQGVSRKINFKMKKDGEGEAEICAAGGDIYSHLLARDTAYRLTNAGEVPEEQEESLVALLVYADKLGYSSLRGELARQDRTKILLPKILALGDSLEGTDQRAKIQRGVEERGMLVNSILKLRRAYDFAESLSLPDDESTLRESDNDAIRNNADKIIISARQLAETEAGGASVGHALPHLSRTRAGFPHDGFQPWKPVEGLIRIPK